MIIIIIIRIIINVLYNTNSVCLSVNYMRPNGWTVHYQMWHAYEDRSGNGFYLTKIAPMYDPEGWAHWGHSPVLMSFLPSGVLQTIYNTLILPHMIYGILAWGRDTKVIHKIQKRAIRIIAASKYNAHTEPLFKQLNLLKACDICKLQELKFYHKLINRQLPKYFECFVYQKSYIDK